MIDITRRRLLKYGLYGGIASGLSPGLWLNGCTLLGWGEKPNIILITVDTLRADHLGCYGYFRNTSPNIDQFAREALLFEKCLSHAPVTSSSIASILSGFLPHETKVLGNLPLPAEVPMLQEVLQRNGYKTAAVVSNYVLRRKNGWNNGFDVYDDEMTSVEIGGNHPERIAENTTKRAIELLKRYQKNKLFLWIHYQDPHGPYTPPERLAGLFQTKDQSPRNIQVNTSLSGYGGIPSYQKLGRITDYYYYVSQYDSEIRYLDEQFKILIEAFKNWGIYDNDLILFSSDHGEGMGEHDYFFAHGENLYNCLLHVPLIIRYGNKLKGKRTDFVQHLDIVPTIQNIVGIKADTRMRGKDLLRQGLGKKEIYAEMSSPIIKGGVKYSIMTGGLKLIFSHISGRFELFDVESDPHESHNLTGNPAYKGYGKHLYAGIKRTREKDLLGLDIENKPRQMTAEEIRKMRSLGYVQ